MTDKRVQLNVKVTTDLKAALDTILERDGVQIAYQVNRALEEWVEKKGVPVKAAAPRKRIAS
jgi:antitoxin component of RelBE/YafQ-DinJ toxin-antitoxin module